MTIKALFPTVRPTLNLDFAKTKVLDPRITFSRASTGTFVGSNGLIQTAVSGAARFDHNPATGESLGLLVEEARTNQALYSGDFSDAAWVVAETTKTANALVALDGTTTAALVKPTAVSASHKFRQNVSTTDSALTFSVYLKAVGYSRIALNEQAQTGSSSAIINLADGTGATSGTVVSNAGNGWYRVSWSSTFGAGVPKVFCVVVLPNGGSGENPNNFTWTGDGTSGIYIWGAQLEAGSFPTSYIPTTTATVTRAADVASMTGTNFSSWWNSNEFTMFADARIRYYPTGYGYFGPIFGFGAGTPRINFGTDEAASRPISVQFYDGTTNHINRTGAYEDLTINSSLKMALSFNGTSSSVTYNNRAISQFTSAAVNLSGVASLKIGEPADTSKKLNGTIARLAFYPVRLPDAQLQALTAT